MAGDRDLELKGMLTDASCALARLDADRLEEMALSCEALVRDVGRSGVQAESVPREFGRELSVFGRIVEATRANRAVLRNLCNQNVRVEYDFLTVRPEETDHGDH